MFYIYDCDNDLYALFEDDELYWTTYREYATEYTTIRGAEKDITYYGIKDIFVVDETNEPV